MNGLRVGTSEIQGRGVFATRAFAVGEEIERCEIIRLPGAERATLAASALGPYLFGFPDDDVAVALGYGSLYNHSDAPNAGYIKDADANLVIVVAEQPIAPGDEITFRYANWSERWANRT